MATYALYTETETSRETEHRKQMSGTLEECDQEFQTLVSGVGVRTPVRTYGYHDSRILKSICIKCDGVVVKSATYIGHGDKRYKRCELMNLDGTRIKFINDIGDGTVRYFTDESVRADAAYREQVSVWRHENREAERIRREYEDQEREDYAVLLAEWKRGLPPDANER